MRRTLRGRFLLHRDRALALGIPIHYGHLLVHVPGHIEVVHRDCVPGTVWRTAHNRCTCRIRRRRSRTGCSANRPSGSRRPVSPSRPSQSRRMSRRSGRRRSPCRHPDRSPPDVWGAWAGICSCNPSEWPCDELSHEQGRAARGWAETERSDRASRGTRRRTTPGLPGRNIIMISQRYHSTIFEGGTQSDP